MKFLLPDLNWIAWAPSISNWSNLTWSWKTGGLVRFPFWILVQSFHFNNEFESDTSEGRRTLLRSLLRFGQKVFEGSALHSWFVPTLFVWNAVWHNEWTVWVGLSRGSKWTRSVDWVASQWCWEWVRILTPIILSLRGISAMMGVPMCLQQPESTTPNNRSLFLFSFLSFAFFLSTNFANETILLIPLLFVLTCLQIWIQRSLS